jgi:cytochrome P450
MTSTASQQIPPGKFGLPVIGETLDFFKDPNFAKKRHQQYGEIFKTRLLGSPTIFLKGPDANRFVLTHENEYFQVSWPGSVKALLGPLSLALQTGHGHVQRRKLLVQAFQPRALEGYLPTMEAICDRYLTRWAELGQFTWYPELRNLTFDIACKLLVGLDNAAETNLGHWFETWCEGLFSIPLNLPWTRFGKAYRCRKRLLEELERLIRDRSTQPDPGTDALGLMLQARDDEGNQLAIEELKDQVLLLLFAGHETLTSALASFCLLMAQNPAVMEQARAEQEAFQDQPLTLDTLKQMTYLEQVLKEVLRMIAPVGGGFRTVLKACEFEGYTIPAGWTVLYQISLTHQDSNIFKSPETFDPDRFAPHRAEDKVKPFSHVPFGGGVRECLGKEFARLEMKLFAAKLLRHYTWQLLPGQDLSLVTVPTPHPKDELKVTFSPLAAVGKQTISHRFD